MAQAKRKFESDHQTLSSFELDPVEKGISTAAYPISGSHRQKLQWTYDCISHCDSVSDFEALIDALEILDTDTFENFGGRIFRNVNNPELAVDGHQFDDRYLILLQLLANTDLDIALKFHLKAESTYKRHANSWIRYTRLQTAVVNTAEYLRKQKASGAHLVKISPAMPDSIKERIAATSTLKKTLTQLDRNKAVVLHTPYENAYTRSFESVSAFDDQARAETMWIDQTLTTDIKNFSVISAPNMRICRAPTGISWQVGNRYQFKYENSDIYHYFRISGRAAFSPVTKHVQQAYFLPRIGNNNYYHSLVDKLPALIAYGRMNLSCPIVATYRLDETERYLCKELGINPDDIIVDTKGALIAERGFIPKVESMRAPFYEHCRTRTTIRATTGKRIYISRSRSADRPLKNENEVHNTLEGRGFSIVHMEDHTFEEQIAIARNASIIVAPHGAGLTNMIFAESGTAVLELIPERYMTPLFKQLAIDCSHRYSTLIGNVAPAEDNSDNSLAWTIDISRLEALIDSL